MKQLGEIAQDKMHNAIGSDLDGGFGLERTPAEIDTVSDLQKIGDALEKAGGYSNADVSNILCRNWLGASKLSTLKVVLGKLI